MAFRKFPKPVVKSLDLETMIEGEYIYILTAVNRHGQKCMIGSAKDLDEAVAKIDDFKELKKLDRYWTGSSGYVDAVYEKKPVARNAK